VSYRGRVFSSDIPPAAKCFFHIVLAAPPFPQSFRNFRLLLTCFPK
jgi:hypothetical protein